MATTWTYGYFHSTTSNPFTTYIDPWINDPYMATNVHNTVAGKHYPKEKDKKVFLILNSKEKSYKVAPDDYHF